MNDRRSPRADSSLPPHPRAANQHDADRDPPSPRAPGPGGKQVIPTCHTREIPKGAPYNSHNQLSSREKVRRAMLREWFERGYVGVPTFGEE
jgi:hypothetical protein